MENCRLEIESRRCAFGLLESWNLHCRLADLANRSKSVTHQAGDCWALENSQRKGGLRGSGRQIDQQVAYWRVPEDWKAALQRRSNKKGGAPAP
jgi:hypothetical protein